MKKGFTFVAIIALVAALTVILVACGVPASSDDSMAKLEKAGYIIEKNVNVQDDMPKDREDYFIIDCGYYAFRATKGKEVLTVVYFDKNDKKEVGVKFRKAMKNKTLVMTVKDKTFDDCYVVYYGSDAAMKVLEK